MNPLVKAGGLGRGEAILCNGADVLKLVPCCAGVCQLDLSCTEPVQFLGSRLRGTGLGGGGGHGVENGSSHDCLGEREGTERPRFGRQGIALASSKGVVGGCGQMGLAKLCTEIGAPRL